ncbi:MAG: 5-formyltetrahydrofolate cyclo-ligase [Rickettsiales bacterium]|nr:5-formyltetrahydrofolate cyclo-ligase [Rickettsiales bacterium]
MIELEKTRLREVFKKQRLALTPKEVAEKSAEVCKNFIENLLPKLCSKNSNKTFSLYLPSSGEVSTEALSQFFQKNSLAFSYPKVIQKNQPLEFILCQTNQSFGANKFYPKILEPITGEKVAPSFLILPLVAFDLNLSRLGMGGGFFDRTISQLKVENPQLVTIGLGYDFQRVATILPTEETDQRLDFVVTEKNIFSRS